MIYRPSTFVIEKWRSLIKRRLGDADLAYLGDTHGDGARVDVPGKVGYVYVHFATGGVNESGGAIYGPPVMVYTGSAAYPNTPGMPVYVGYGYSGELEIKQAHAEGLRQAGIDARVLNPLNQQSKFVYLWQLTMGLASAVATSVTDSYLITVKSFRHYVGNTFQTFETPLEVNKIDLAPYVPATDMHCYAAIWLDTYTNTVSVTTSTAQALSLPLDATDVQECAANRPADAIPLKAFYLSNNQATITQNARDTELRQVLNAPHIWGFPNILSHIERVRPNRTLVTGPYTTSGVGAITLLSGAQHIIVYKNNLIATTAPAAGNDSSQGYSISSMWFNTATGLLYVATSVGVGTATWVAISGSGVVFPAQTANTGFYGPTTGAAAAPTFRVMVTNDISAGIVTPSRFGNSGSGSGVVLYDVAGDPQLSHNAVDIEVIWGETVAPGDFVYLKATSNRFWRADGDSGSVLMSSVRGVVVYSTSPFTAGNDGIVRVYGNVDNCFTGLTNGEPMYLGTAAGSYTQTSPSPSLGGVTILNVRYGHASSATQMFVDCHFPVRYMKRASLADVATTTIIHQADVTISTRKPLAAVSSNDVAVIETSGGAQDSSRPLKGQSGAGQALTIDNAGVTNNSLGDLAGTDYRDAQSFTITAGQLTQITVYFEATTGTPSQAPTWEIQPDSAGNPASGTPLASGTMSAITQNADNTITVTNGPFLEAATTYWFVIALPIQATNNYYNLRRNAGNPYANGLLKRDQTTGASFPGTWTSLAAGSDMRMSVTTAAVVLNDKLAQGFSHSATTTVLYVDILLKRTGTLAGNLALEIQTNSAGLPSNTVITNGTSTTVLASSVTTGYTLIRFTFATPPSITASTQYHMVLTTTDVASNTAYIEWGIDISSPPYANGAFALLNPTWSAASPAADGIFDMYGVTTTFTTTAAAGFWFSTKNDVVCRFDNGSGGSPTTQTTFKNTSGTTLDVTCIVEMP